MKNVLVKIVYCINWLMAEIYSIYCLFSIQNAFDDIDLSKELPPPPPRGSNRFQIIIKTKATTITEISL